MNPLERLRAALADRYVVERELGQDGIAMVFLAEDGKRKRRAPGVWPSLSSDSRFDTMNRDVLPGAELVEQGLRDLDDHAETVESLLVSLGAPGLRTLGLRVPEPWAEPELRLYRLLAERHGAGAHARYNALLRRLVSFQRASACAK